MRTDRDLVVKVAEGSRYVAFHFSQFGKLQKIPRTPWGGVLGEFLFMQQSVSERDLCSVMPMNSSRVLRIEAEDRHKRLRV